MRFQVQKTRQTQTSFWSRFRDNLSSDFAIDLGTANSRVFVNGKGIVINEPTVVAMHNVTNSIVAIGSSAHAMLGRTPQNISIIEPLSRGVISDFETTEALLKHFVGRAKHSTRKTFGLLFSRLILSIPSGVTEVERKAMADVARTAGLRKVILVEEPMAAAIGAELPIREAKASMVVDFGGGVTEISVLSWQGIVHSRLLPIAGDELDEAIVDWVRQEKNLFIGKQTAEELKRKIVQPSDIHEVNLETTVSGRDIATGLPKESIVSQVAIYEAIIPLLRRISEAIRELIEDTPPELVADLVKGGMVICGGGALLPGLSQFLANELKINVRVAENPQLCVILGLSKILNDAELLSEVEVTWNK